MEAVSMLGMQFKADAGAVVAGQAAPEDRYLIAAALDAFNGDDLTAASAVLEPFGLRWHRYGTAALGYALFLREDPGAYQVLEMYVAEHTTKTWEASAGTPEDLAFYLVARLRHVLGDDTGARAAVGWINPSNGAGPVATTWLAETLGAPPNAQR
jgi:hypothetical protein